MKKGLKKAAAICLVLSFLLSVIPLEARAAVLEIRYNGKTWLYQDMQPKILYGGQQIRLPNSPALIMDNVAMVPYHEVFIKNGPKAKKEGYNSATKQLVLSLDGKKIVLVVGSTTAYVNGVKKTLPVAPVSVTYTSTKTTRILVPSRAICSYWGIGYSWNKKTQTVTMTAPTPKQDETVRTYYRGSKAYKAKVCSVNYEGTTLNLSKTPAVTIGKYNMIPYYEALCKMGPKARRSYNAKTKIVKIRVQSNTLTMKVGSKSANINGEKVMLPVAPISIKYTKKGPSYIMVPARNVALYLGLAYNYASADRAISLQKALSIKYNNKYYCYTGNQNTVYVNDKKVSSTIPSIDIGGIPYLPINFVCQDKYGLGVTYSYKSKQATLDTGFHKIVMTMGSAKALVDEEQKTMTGKALLVRLIGKKKNYVMLPAQYICEALDLSYQYNNAVITLKPSEEIGNNPAIPSEVSTNYKYTLNAYAAKQKALNDNIPSYRSVTLSQYINYLDPAKDTTEKYQFLRLDTYRPIQVASLSSLLSTQGKKGVLKDKAMAINNAAKRYKLDPVYFMAQCIHETGWGTSELSKGITSDEVALPSYNANGELVGFTKDPATGKYKTQKLPKKYTAYNLFGIKAYDDAAQLCGFSYAYYNGWFTVDAAIEGGAKYLSDNYVHHAINQQNTLYKIRFHPTDLNHQYATDPAYAVKTANHIKSYSYLYQDTASFQYEYPVFMP